MRRLIQRLGRSRVPVLLSGETGTGKEVAARAIHAVRNEGPFVPIDCTVLGTLLETELFGHTRGAFTGAIANKTGLLSLAEGGTAFFDEIAELALELQVKLLRVLQLKEVRPVGAVAGHKTDFRILAATNRDLAREVERGRFRADLYYRLNVVTVRMPPLRERREDIAVLANQFIERNGGDRSITARLLEVLERYDWPGNVRELENCVQRMMAVNSGPLLDLTDLPSAVEGWLASPHPGPPGPLAAAAAAAAAAGATAAVAPLAFAPPGRARVVPLEQLERQAIVDALAATRGDLSRAAHLLGIGRTTMYRKLKRYGLERGSAG